MLAAPMTVFIVGVVYTIWVFAVMPTRVDPNIANVLRKSILTVILFVFLFVIQRFREHRFSYVLMMVGLAVLFLGELENVLDEFAIIDYGGIGADLEDLNAFSLLLVGIGLFLYTDMLSKARLRTEQSRRETELYATLLRHDLRNDLQAVLGYIELTENEIDQPAVMLDSARMAATRMSRLVKAFSIHDDGEEHDLLSLVKLTAIDAEKAHQGLTIKVEAGPGVDGTDVYGGALIQSAFENLFRNTAQYCGENPDVSVQMKRIGDRVEIYVSDNGPGIPKEKCESLFLRGLTSSDTGLGLYLTKTILRGCGGSIEHMESEDGTSFKIEIPVRT